MPAATAAYGPHCICAAYAGPGRFADAPERIPHEAIVHLAGQIGIHPPAGLAILPRQATESAIRDRVRKYLGFVPFSVDAEARLTVRLAELALDGLGSAELVERAEAFLLAAHVVLPAHAALERLVASLNCQALEALFTRIAGRFAASTCAAFDRLVGNADDDDVEVDGKSTVGRYRTPPASSMGRFTRTAGERLEEINVLLDGRPDLSDISHRVRRQLAELCRRYDVMPCAAFRPPNVIAWLPVSCSIAGKGCWMTWSRHTTTT